MDGDDSDASSRFALGDTDVMLPHIDITLLQSQHFSDSHTRIEQYQHSIDSGLTNVLPKSIDFLAAKWFVRADGFIFPDRQ